MPTLDTAKESVRSFLEEREPIGSRYKTLVRGFYRDTSPDSTLPTVARMLASYGPHFPLLIETDGGWWLNIEDYIVSDAERAAAGWGPRGQAGSHGA